MTAFIGIDSGKDGALAAILPNGTIVIYDTPTLDVGKGSRRDYDDATLSGNLGNIVAALGVDGCRVALERVHAMKPQGRQQGVASMFSQGEGQGLWRGLLSMAHLPWEWVTPQAWKKELMQGQPKEKKASVLVASRLFPSYAHLFRGPRGGTLDGRADAVLIAEYLRRKHGQR